MLKNRLKKLKKSIIKILNCIAFFTFVITQYHICKAQDSSKISIITRIVNFGFVEPDSPRTPDVIILHSSYCPTKKDSFNLKCILSLYKKYDVSAHYIIDRGGKIYQLVDEKLIAHHGGKGILPDGDIKINTRSLGIELINTKSSKYTESQYIALATLILDIKKRCTINYILGHNEIAPGRKTDPWNFDWNKINELLKISSK